MGEKSLFITYVLWFFFGWLGVHHFYLRRDKQAFIWWTTWGGFFYYGWFRDSWRIPEYVDDVNNQDEFIDNLHRKMKLRKQPVFNSTRFAGEMFVGYFYGTLVSMAIPESTPYVIVATITCIGTTVGVYLVGNIGREQGPFYSTFIATLISFFLLSIIANGKPESYMYSSLVGALTFNYFRKFRKTHQRREKNNWTRLSHLSMGASIYFLLWSSYFYFNASIELDEGEKIKLSEAMNHFFKSPAWLDFKKTMWEIYQEGQKKGWHNIYFEFVKAFDPTGIENAYRTLGLPNTASSDEIRQAYKKLVIQWHPDRNQGDDKKGAELQFIEIQQAYEILNKKKKSTVSSQEKQRTEF